VWSPVGTDAPVAEATMAMTAATTLAATGAMKIIP